MTHPTKTAAGRTVDTKDKRDIGESGFNGGTGNDLSSRSSTQMQQASGTGDLGHGGVTQQQASDSERGQVGDIAKTHDVHAAGSTVQHAAGADVSTGQLA